MSICSTVLEALADGGREIDDCIIVARAMARGEDRSRIYTLFDALLETDCTSEALAVAVLALAHEINAHNTVYLREQRPSHIPSAYKQRLGLSPKAWGALREKVFQRDGRNCTYCGSDNDPTVDHVVPLVRGGTNDMENLTPACRSCNSSKGDKLLSEWRATA